MDPNMRSIAPEDHQGYLKLALECARNSPPKPTNFRVGAVLVNSKSNTVLATGYTLELPGNTHAEQCALAKYQMIAKGTKTAEDTTNVELPEGTILYTTMEPCVMRLSGNLPCVDRILRTRLVDGKTPGIEKVYVGVKEPETFVGENKGSSKLEEAGVKVVHVNGMEEEILAVAMEGHKKKDEDVDGAAKDNGP